VIKNWHLVGGPLAAPPSHGTTGTMVNPALRSDERGKWAIFFRLSVCLFVCAKKVKKHLSEIDVTNCVACVTFRDETSNLRLNNQFFIPKLFDIGPYLLKLCDDVLAVRFSFETLYITTDVYLFIYLFYYEDRTKVHTKNKHK